MSVLKRYRVTIPELHWSVREVMAKNEEDAMEKSLDVQEVSIEYERVFERDEIEWDCELIDDSRKAKKP